MLGEASEAWIGACGAEGSRGRLPQGQPYVVTSRSHVWEELKLLFVWLQAALFQTQTQISLLGSLDSKVFVVLFLLVHTMVLSMLPFSFVMSSVGLSRGFYKCRWLLLPNFDLHTSRLKVSIILINAAEVSLET